MEASGPAQPTRGQPPAIRVGDRDRDAVVHRLQDAFAEGRLDDEEFDQRTRAALIARTGAELEVLTADLAAPAARPGVRVELDGFGVSNGWTPEEDLEGHLPGDAPVVHVRGLAYKATIEVSTRPAGAGRADGVLPSLPGRS